MTTQEALGWLLERGISITDRTLQNYVRQELVRKPIRKGLGRGRGKMVKWDKFTLAEVYACWLLIHGLHYSPEKVRDIRKRAILGKHEDEDVKRYIELFNKAI